MSVHLLQLCFLQIIVAACTMAVPSIRSPFTHSRLAAAAILLSPNVHTLSSAPSTSSSLQIIVAVAINKERPMLPSETPPRLAALISRCWLEDPAARPRVAELATELQDMMQVCYLLVLFSLFVETVLHVWCNNCSMHSLRPIFAGEETLRPG
jgi:hypothetical protein